jgi:hypothetical protein
MIDVKRADGPKLARLPPTVELNPPAPIKRLVPLELRTCGFPVQKAPDCR